MTNSYSSKIVLHKYVSKKGTSSILLQVIIDRKKIEINTGISVQPYLFNKNTGTVIHGGPVTKEEAKDANLRLDQTLAKSNEVFIRARLGNLILTPNKFKEMYANQLSYAHIDFIKFMDEEIKRLKGSKTRSTLKSYSESARKIKVFQKQIMFDELTESLLEDFDRFMIEKELSPNTRSKHHKTFTKIVFVKQQLVHRFIRHKYVLITVYLC